MEPILVPAPPKGAFNKNRRMSDLIRNQVEHFKHLEHSLPAEARAKLPQHAIVSEDDAARYIAPFTQMLLAQSAGGVTTKRVKVARMADAGKAVAADGLAIAAVAEKTRGQQRKSKPTATARKRKP